MDTKPDLKAFVIPIYALVYWGAVYGYAELALFLRELRARTYAMYPQVLSDFLRVCLFVCLGVLLLYLFRHPISCRASLTAECILLLLPALCCCLAAVPTYLPLQLGGLGDWLAHNGALLLPVGGILLPVEIARLVRYARKN